MAASYSVNKVAGMAASYSVNKVAGMAASHSGVLYNFQTQIARVFTPQDFTGQRKIGNRAA